MQICIWISKYANLKIIPVCKNLSLHSPEVGECLVAVKKKDRSVILQVIVIIIE